MPTRARTRSLVPPKMRERPARAVSERLAGGLVDFVDLAIPELQSRGLFHAECGGATLRDNMGLQRPLSRYSTATA
jgi:hypothetical protein